MAIAILAAVHEQAPFVDAVVDRPLVHGVLGDLGFGVDLVGEEAVLAGRARRSRSDAFLERRDTVR